MAFPDQVERWRSLVRKHTPADMRGDPNFERIALAVLMAESGGRPDAPGDIDKRTGVPHSIGLYQLHDEGMGSGLSRQQRSDPEVNAGRAVPALAAAYRRNRGDPVRTYIQAINPGALPDGPQVRGVMAAHARGTGGPKVQARVTRQSTRGGTAVEAYPGEMRPSATDPNAAVRVTAADAPTMQRPAGSARSRLIENYRKQLAEAEAELQAMVERETGPDALTPDEVRGSRAAAPVVRRIEELRDAIRTAESQMAAAEDRGEADPEVARIEREAAQVALDAARAKAAAATSPEAKRLAEIELEKAELALDAARKKAEGGDDIEIGGRIVRRTPEGTYETVYDEPEEMTPYQAGSLGIDQQQLELDRIKQDYAERKMTYEQAEKAVDYILNRPRTSTVGGKRYEAGFEPGGGAIKHYGSFGFNVDPREATDIDYATVLGAPRVNESVYSNDYPFAQPGLASAAPMRRPAAAAVPPPAPAPAPEVAPAPAPAPSPAPTAPAPGVPQRMLTPVGSVPAPPQPSPAPPPAPGQPPPPSAGPPGQPPPPAGGPVPMGMLRPTGGDRNLMTIQKMLEGTGVPPAEAARLAQTYLAARAGGGA